MQHGASTALEIYLLFRINQDTPLVGMTIQNQYTSWSKPYEKSYWLEPEGDNTNSGKSDYI